MAPAPTIFCGQCGYNLAGLPTGPCPECASTDRVDQIRFTCSRRDWLLVHWKGAALVNVLAWGTLLFVLAASLQQPWRLLLLLPWWFLFGSRAVRTLMLLATGSMDVVIYLPEAGSTHQMIAVSNDGGESVGGMGVPIVISLSHAWLVRGSEGTRQVVIPRRAITAQQRDLFAARTGVQLVN